MRKRIIAVIVATAALTQLPGVAEAGPSMCRIMEKLGYEWVREYEDPSS